MTKKKWYTRAIYLGVALAMTLGLVVMPVGAQHDPEIEICSSLNVAGLATAAWVNTPVGLTHDETVTVLGDYSARLSDGGAGSSSYSQLIVPGLNIPLPGITELSFWFNYTNPLSPDYIPALSLHIDTNGDGVRDFVACVTMTAGDIKYGDQFTEGTWEMWDLTTPVVTNWGTEPIWHGTDYINPAFSHKTFAEVQAIAALLAPATDAVVLYVMIGEGAWGGGQTWTPSTTYVDDITIEGTTYDVEPCYWLEPDIAKNVKTADETFTVMDACGEVNGDLVSDWMVTKGEGTGAVTIVAGGAAGDNYITVRMVTTGDCIITCNVAGLYHPVNAEKKWGEIYYTELTAWAENCTVAHPIGAETEISRVIDLGGNPTVDVVVQEAVIANFLPGPVPAYAGGAKITWWLLENDEDGYAQADLEELVELFDSYDYVSGELGYGHGCGQYAEWAGDPTFIPEDIIDTIYATYEASNTEFTRAECADIVDTTKTVTYTDHVGDPLGEGFTNVLVEFSDVGTGLAEPAIVVVLADYPLDKNGENAVCVEYFKFKSTVVVIPEVCQVKVPQVRWAGEKIVLEKDWETNLADQLVGFFLEEGCVGNMIPFPGDEGNLTAYIISEDARTAFTVTDCAGIARAMFESEQQGQVDVKCVLYGSVGQDLGGMTFAAIAAQTGNGGELEVVGNHGFLVYYLALENVAVDTGLSDLTAIDAGVDADVLVKVRGWFTSAALPGTSRPPVDANGDLVYELPAGRYVLPDDWAALAGSDEATSNMASRPQYDLMNTPGDGVDSAAELGPYDSGVRTTTPPGMADDPVIGPFNTLQPWNCVDDAGDPTNMWIADDVVPADYTVAIPITGARTVADLRNTVVPDTTIDEFDCPMPQALVTFDVEDTEVLNALDKGNVFFSGSGASKVYTAPFYAAEIPSHWLIPVGGYRWDSWGGWTLPTTDDGPYDFWTDLGITPTAVDILEVYSDNHGYAGVTIEGEDLADDCVTLDVVADFPVMAAKYIAVDTDAEVCWGEAIEHLNADFEVSDRTGEAAITISFYGLRLAGTGAPWTAGGTQPYVKAEWDFDGDGTIDATIEGATSALTLVTQTFEFTTANSYSPWLRVTDDDGLVDVCEKPNYIVLTGPAGFPLCDIDESGTVDLADFVLFAASYGLSLEDVGYDGRCDLDESDGVGILDFVLFAECWAVEA